MKYLTRLYRDVNYALLMLIAVSISIYIIELAVGAIARTIEQSMSLGATLVTIAMILSLPLMVVGGYVGLTREYFAKYID